MRKTVLPRRSASAALKTSCLGIPPRGARGTGKMPGLQSTAVLRVIRQSCKRYSGRRGPASLLYHLLSHKTPRLSRGKMQQFQKNLDFFLEVSYHSPEGRRSCERNVIDCSFSWESPNQAPAPPQTQRPRSSAQRSTERSRGNCRISREQG